MPYCGDDGACTSRARQLAPSQLGGDQLFIKGETPDPLPSDVVAALSKVQTSTLGHLRDYGFPRGVSPLQKTGNCVGPAITVRLPHMDSTALHVAVDELRPGDVLVVEQSGDDRSAFGGMVGTTAQARGAAGVIVTGAVNDVRELLELQLPIYCSGVSARTTRILGIEGAINVPISVGGVAVQPGDIMMCDPDGVAVLDRGDPLGLAETLANKEATEPDLKRKIYAGGHLSDTSGAKALFYGNDSAST